MTEKFENDLSNLVRRFGQDRIARAIEPVFLTTGENTLRAALHDRELYQSLSEFEKTTLIEAHMRLYWKEDATPVVSDWTGLLAGLDNLN